MAVGLWSCAEGHAGEASILIGVGRRYRVSTDVGSPNVCVDVDGDSCAYQRPSKRTTSPDEIGE